MKNIFVAVLAVAFCILPARGFAIENNATFEGTISATLTRGGTEPAAMVFTRKGNLLRIENTTNKLEPINIVDLAANKLTIVYPHNTTFVQVDLTKGEAQTGAPNLPPGLRHDGGATTSQAGFPPPPNMNTSPGEAATASGRAGPAISPPPGFPTPPPMPSRPPMPNPAAAMPMMPPMPAMGGFGGTPELKKTDKTKKIQGFDCTLYTISDRMETFEIWATADSALFPFRLVQTNYLNRRFGPRMLEEQWIELLQKKSLFPLEATLRMDVRPHPALPAANGGKEIAPSSAEHGQERLSFKVDKIDSPSRTDKKIDDEALFKAPENFYEINAQPF